MIMSRDNILIIHFLEYLAILDTKIAMTVHLEIVGNMKHIAFGS